MPPLIGPLLSFGNAIIEKFFPSEEGKLKAKAGLLKMHQQGELNELEVSMVAILAEAKSNDKFTSRARPTFLYVMYILVLTAIPMGILNIFDPNAAHLMAIGMRDWLAAIPNGLWSVFGAGYLGYSVSRSYDKRNILRSDKQWISKS